MNFSIKTKIMIILLVGCLSVTVVGTIGLDSWIRSQPKKDQKLYYFAWTVVSLYTVENNRKKGFGGFPVVVPIIRIKF